MRPGRGQPDQRVTDTDGTAVEDRRFLDNTNAEPGQVVIAFTVHARHFSRFATDQGRTCQFTTGGNTLDDIAGDIQVEFAGCVVVKKEQRFGTGDHDIVDAHGDQVDTDAVMQSGLYRQLQLGAHTVSARDQHRFPIAVQWQLEQGAKAPQSCQHPRSPGFRNRRFDAFDQLAAGIDVHTGVPVAQTA